MKLNQCTEQKDVLTIPKDVAMAIFREGVAHGVSSASDVLAISRIPIAETGGTRWIDPSEHLDLDWMRSEVGVNDEADVIKGLKDLCTGGRLGFRILGIDDNPTTDTTRTA